MTKFIDGVRSTLEDYKDRVAQRAEQNEGTTAEDAEDEADELRMAIEDDQTLLSDMNKAFHAIFKNHGKLQQALEITRDPRRCVDPKNQQG